MHLSTAALSWTGEAETSSLHPEHTLFGGGT
jgi:hypothetical protein